MKNFILFLFSFLFLQVSQAQVVNIPDAAFKNYLINQHQPVIDTNGDGEIQTSEAEAMNELNIVFSNNNTSIQNLTGLEAFINLTELTIENLVEVTNIDINALQNLERLKIHRTGIFAFDISANQSLEAIDLRYNFALDIDLTNNEALEEVFLWDNALSEIDLSNNESLKILYLGGNQLLEIDLTNNINLEEVILPRNGLSEIDLSNNLNLVTFEISENFLSSLDVSNNTNLTSLFANRNEISTINLSNLENLLLLDLYDNQLTEIDLSDNSNLNNLNLSQNALTQVDLSQMQDLKSLKLSFNELVQLDLTQNPNLEDVNVGHNPFTELDLSNNAKIKHLTILKSDLHQLDVSQVSDLEIMSIWEHYNMISLNLKNGNTAGINLSEGLYSILNLEVICLDDIDALQNFVHEDVINRGVLLTTNCSFDPYNYNTIQGNVRYLSDGECSSEYGTVPIPQRIVKATDQNGDLYAAITDDQGNYMLKVSEGDYIVELNESFPDYFDLNPVQSSISFAGFANTEELNFCVEANQQVEDLSLSIDYKWVNLLTYSLSSLKFILTIENNGTQSVDPEFNILYDEDYFQYANCQPQYFYNEEGLLKINFSELKPFHKTQFNIFLAKKSDAEFNIGDVHEFTFKAKPDENDLTPLNNIVVYADTVTSSYDPNNKIVWQGSEINIEQAQDYLNYTVNFQNTGNANADRVEIIDTLSKNLNIESLNILSSSHIYRTKIEIDHQTEDVILHFIFNNIDLTYEDADEEESQGYIAYKIKPIEGLNVGDVMESPADIYFDQNEAVRTNVATTKIIEEDFKVISKDEIALELYPIPTDGMLYFLGTEDRKLESIEVFTMTGQRIFKEKNTTQIDLSKLSSGVYFLKIIDHQGYHSTRKIIKK